MPLRKDLASALLEEHALRADALERAWREHERSARPLWAVLIELGLCSEDGLFRVLVKRGGAAVIPEERLLGLQVPVELRQALPAKLAGELGVLPLERSADGKRVALALVDPLMDAPALRTILVRLGVAEVHRFLIHRAVLRRCLGALYAGSVRTPRPTEELPLSDRPTGLVNLPEHDPRFARGLRRSRARNDEKTERIGNRPGDGQGHPSSATPGSLHSPPVQPIPGRPPPSTISSRPAAVTQPMPPVTPAAVERPSTVQIDPQLAREIELMGEERGGEPTQVPARPLPSSATTPTDRSSASPVPAPAPSSESPPPSSVSGVIQAPGPGRVAAPPALPAFEDRLRQIQAAAGAALELLGAGTAPDALPGVLRERLGSTQATETLLQLLLVPAAPRRHREETTDPDPTKEQPLPGPRGHDGAMDQISDPEIEIEMVDVSDAGLEIYHFDEN